MLIISQHFKKIPHVTHLQEKRQEGEKHDGSWGGHNGVGNGSPSGTGSLQQVRQIQHKAKGRKIQACNGGVQAELELVWPASSCPGGEHRLMARKTNDKEEESHCSLTWGERGTPVAGRPEVAHRG